MKRHRWLIALAAIATVLTFSLTTLVPTDADARAGRGASSGSRGERTFTAPAATRTAPNAAQPMQRTTTQPSTAAAGQAATRPGLLGGGLFGGGMLGGLAAGFIGAGLFGMLFGHGFMGGMGGFASILGLIIQVVLVIVVARLAFAWWQRRKGQASEPALAMQGTSPAPGASPQAFGGLGSMFGGNAPAAPAGEPITIGKADYDEFEKLLVQVQEAYSAEDEARLRALATPEMVSYFAEQQQEYGSRGLVNRVSDVKLLNGDLSEAWREGVADYATVAMNFQLTDRVVERASGKTVEGGESAAVTEAWTFTRTYGGAWLLSAIQQT